MTRLTGRWRTALTVTALAATLTAGLAATPQAEATDVAAANGRIVARLTGPGSINDTFGRFNIVGTDLGVLWDNGHGEIMAAFGDTQTFNGWSL
ncbi:MAG: DUF4185 domain-containing protein, partial [Mycobacterium sp.]|nr:DUF4185 domain-containing protein [Mycobacterium sp.]